jgi:hypothetical protein
MQLRAETGFPTDSGRNADGTPPAADPRISGVLRSDPALNCMTAVIGNSVADGMTGVKRKAPSSKHQIQKLPNGTANFDESVKDDDRKKQIPGRHKRALMHGSYF